MSSRARGRPPPGASHELVLGRSFRAGAAATHATMRYSFKPSSVEWRRRGHLSVRGPAVEVRMPKTGGGTVVLRGKADAHKASECLLICRADGQWVLERLGSNFLQLQAEREEPSRQPAPGRAALAAKAKPSGDADVEPSALFGDDDDADGVPT